MKRTILFTVLCAVTFAPAKATWSFKYWYCPGAWSEAGTYFQIGSDDGKDGKSAIYAGGEGALPDSDGANTENLPFQARGVYTYYLKSLPWRVDGGLGLDKVVWQFSTVTVHDVTTLTVDEGITHIGNWWFAGLGRLQEVSLPSTLESIGERTFDDCEKLPEITIPDKVYYIGSRAFYACLGLKHIKIPANAALFDEVFRNSGLESVDLKGPARLRGKYVFQDCENFKHFTVSAGSTLGDCALANSSLETVTVNDNISFGNYAFQNCTNLKSVTFRGRINAVTEGMFQGSSSLESIRIPDGLAVTSIGNSSFDGCSGLKTVYIPNGVTSIGANAFHLSRKLISVTIPNSVTKIGAYAFQQSGLTLITVPGSVKDIEFEVFAWCGNLTSVNLCEGVKTIISRAFLACEKLETVSLPASLEYVDVLAFGQCNNIKIIECNGTIPPAMHPQVFNGSDITKTSVFVPSGSVDAYRNADVWKNFKNIGAYSAGIHIINGKDFTVNSGSKVKLTAGLTPHNVVPAITWTSSNSRTASAVDGIITAYAPGEVIITATTGNGILKDSCKITVKPGSRGLVLGKDYFQDSQNAKYITIPANCTLEDGIFTNHSTLETVTVNDNVTFGKYAFLDCKNLKSVTFQGRINAITERMFWVCSSLLSINIPNGVTSIGNSAFFTCVNLQSVNIPNSVTSIGDSAFALTKLPSVTIPNSVTKLGACAFDCSSLTSITVPGSMKEIPGSFSFCGNLTSATICEGVGIIGRWTFQDCRNLETVSLPASLEYVGAWVFTRCNKLKFIECNSSTPPTAHFNAFGECDLTGVTLYVPQGSVDAYRNAEVWKDFPNIVAYPDGNQPDN